MKPLGLALLLAVGCAHGSRHVVLQREPTEPSVGFVQVSAMDPMTEKSLKVAVFYPPATSLRTATQMGPYRIEAKEEVPAQSGKFPLIIISHGHAGTRFGHHDLAEHLARNGFVVATLEHAGDSWNDQSTYASAVGLFRRANQVSATIDAVFADARIGPHVDRRRVGVAGFSAGGFTSLLVMGAVPDFSRIDGYCTRHPADTEICTPQKDIPVPTNPKPTKDDRVKAAFVMEPFGVPYGPASFEKVTGPVFLYTAEKDTVLVADENLAAIRQGVHTLVGTAQVPNADHYVFVAPCSSELAADAAMICEDPSGVDRIAVHEDINKAAVEFFTHHL